MGIDLNCAQLLIRAAKNGLVLGHVVTLGRLDLHPDRRAIVSLLRTNRFELSGDTEKLILDHTNKYCETFMRVLGATEITAMDVSSYEGAQLIHDLNKPIPESFDSHFDLVFDGGTLEHVFDYTTAVRNAIRMVKPGGTFISATMANNFCGHGFYQFAPELYYRLLCRENGYRMESCILWEDIQSSLFYQVPDPFSLKSRIELTSRSGMYLWVQAKREGEVLQDFIPQQSDYVTIWKAGADKVESVYVSGRLRSTLRKVQIFRSLVLHARDLRQKTSFFRPGAIKAIYRGRRLDRNWRACLVPINKLTVKL